MKVSLVAQCRLETNHLNDMTKKKFLILTENLGKTAPGIVFERLVGEIAARHDVVVVCLNDFTSGNSLGAYTQRHLPRSPIAESLGPKTKARLSKVSLALVGDDWTARLNAATLEDVFSHNVKFNGTFDYIFSMVSFRHTSPSLLAEKLIQRGMSTNNIAYFVDAIPAPIGWSVDNRVFRGLRNFAVQRMKKIDVLFSSNAQMLEYQLGLAMGHAPISSGVLFNPIVGGMRIFPPPATGRYNFLYTGGIYGKRTPKHIFGALKKALKVNQNIYLVFVGASIEEQDLAILNDHEKAHVVIEPFVRNLDPYYQDAVALVDIDADMENDVYLSSKVTNYLQVNRMILSETGANSPASRLLGGLDSIVQCPHDADKIADCMIKVIEKSETVSFDDRKLLIDAFSVGAVVGQMETLLGLSR